MMDLQNLWPLIQSLINVISFITRPLTHKFSYKFKENGFSIEIEIVAKYLKTNRLVYEVPIRYHGRSYEEGKKITTVDGFKYLYNTLKYKIYS